MEKKFPEGMKPLGDASFNFQCHENVSCFTKCCRKVDMFLFPYDILRLKNGLKMDSHEFMREHTRVVTAENPYFPAVMLNLKDDDCPFLTAKGCRIYRDRPSACRTYPLERGVDRSPKKGEQREFYFLTRHDYCMGHNEEKRFNAREWVRNQRLDQYNLMNDLWAEMDTLFSTNPWRGEGAGGEKQRLAFMVCYDIDGFRKFVEQHSLLKRFRLEKDLRRRIRQEDEELLKFGFEWLKFLLGSGSSLVQK